MTKFKIELKDLSTHMLKVMMGVAKAQPPYAECKKTIERLQAEIDRRNNND